MQSPYWIDADVLIQASNLHYRFQRVPKFWVFLEEQVQNGVIRCPKIIWQEVCDGTGDLAQWMQTRRSTGFCVSASKSVQQQFGNVSAYVVEKYKGYQAAEFLRGGDGWAIAHVLDSGGTVVTQESPRSKRGGIKVPTVCKGLNVRCLDTFKMLDEMDAGPF